MKRFLVILIVISTCSTIRGASSEIVTLCAQSDFTDGNLENVKIDSGGWISLSGTMQTLAEIEAESAVWSLAMDHHGSVYAGTGNNGMIYRLHPGEKPEVIFDSPEIAILSLACRFDGSIFAGTAPDGLIYQITRDSCATVFARTEQHYVWDLIIDPAGNLIAATGDQAKILYFSQSGSRTFECDLDAGHVRTLALCGNSLLAGTADPATLYRLTGTDLQVVYDAKQREISRVVCTGSQDVFFSAVASPAISGTEIKPGMALLPGQNREGDREIGTVYRITSSGVVESWWSTAAVPIFDMVLMGEHPVVACGSKGFVFEIEGPDLAALISTVAESPVLTLLPVSSGLLMGTSNQTSVLKLTGDPSHEGSYESDVFDAETVSRWGMLTYQALNSGSGEIDLETRSGNRKSPDDLWSKWASVVADTGGFRIQSPPARFLQWRALFKSRKTSPVLGCIQFSVARPNRTPRLSSVIVYPVQKGVFIDQMIPSGKLYRQEFSDGTRLEYSIQPQAGIGGVSKGQWFKLRGMRTVRWDAADPDLDLLESEIAISTHGSERWTILETEYDTPIFTFDSTAFPDGVYEIRITISDRPSNPRNLDRSASMVSRAFTIDNTPPILAGLTAEAVGTSGSTIRLSGKARDDLNRIVRLEYSFNSEKWYSFTGKDGILDSCEEQFELVLPQPENRTEIFVRATDDHENVTTASVPVKQAGEKK
ncbi:hypothetical protein JXA40_12455 [bacterium]|nr:hypothetical protein [candidate division CSSED10-310 bacterium]